VSFWAALLAEARQDQVPALVAALALTVILCRRAPLAERKRLRSLALLTVLVLLALPLCAWLRATAQDLYRDVRLTLLAIAILAAVGMATTLLFSVGLPRVHIRSPRILRDVVAAGASMVLILSMASRLGINLSGIIATSAVVTAVIGLSLQDTLGNVMAGLALQLDDSVSVGDWVKVGDSAGVVREIGWRSTSVETRNWETVVIPNSVLVKNAFLVLGRRQGQPQLLRRWVYFNVDYRVAPTEVIAAVASALDRAVIPHVARDPAPQCILYEFTDSFGRYAVRYWLDDMALDDPTDSAVRARVYFALKRAGISLSIPAQALFLTQESTERKKVKQDQEHERRLRALQQLEFFAHLPPEALGDLADGLHPAPFVCGEIMTRQGAQAHYLYLLIHGTASVHMTTQSGREREIGRLCDGDFFGEMSLMTGEPRAATVIAETDVDCYRMDRPAFEQLLRERPELAERIAEVLADRRVHLIEAREELDEAGRGERVKAAKHDLAARIREFFGLDGK
jgi:small-conductance mechanosensitive channel